ncbi:MAG TPA: diguanylate cyclase [Pyrinomonadaceae bacterium]|jgi:diguanylate cyclase (GGDEF)-like protein
MPEPFTVLVVDDEPDKRQLLSFALQAEGYNVLTADNGVEGLRAVESHYVDLVVTDVMMPEMDGYEMVRRMRANPQTRFIPVIIQSAARADARDTQRGAEAGALGYITDPTDLDLLRARARTLLELKRYMDSTEEAAFSDDLTLLANNRRFRRQLEREVTRTQKYGRPFCLCLLEVDDFARINETAGRTVGEEVLRSVAKTLQAGTRGIDLAARLEQSLFAVVLTETDFEGCSEVARRLVSAIEALNVPGAGGRVTATFGIAEFPTAARDSAGLLEAAHLALAGEKGARRAAYDKALRWVKDYVAARGRADRPPTCFISYAWSTREADEWAAALAGDLRDAGIKPILDRRDNAAIGSNIPRFISRIETCDFIVVIGTPLYLKKYRNEMSEAASVAAAEMDLINERLIGTEGEKNSVLPLLREGEPKDALPALMRGRVRGDFRREESYLQNLLDLILTLHGIPFDDPAVEGFRRALRVLV